MNGLTALIWLQAEAPSIFQSFLIPVIMVFGIFYLLVFRPQQRQRSEHEALLKSIEKGDTVVTSGGLHGKVTGTTDDILTVEIANLKGERVRVKVDRSRVERRVSKADGEGGS